MILLALKRGTRTIIMQLHGRFMVELHLSCFLSARLFLVFRSAHFIILYPSSYCELGQSITLMILRHNCLYPTDSLLNDPYHCKKTYMPFIWPELGPLCETWIYDFSLYIVLCEDICNRSILSGFRTNSTIKSAYNAIRFISMENL